MCKRVYLKAKEAEMEMQEARNAEGFTGKTEKLLIANMVKAAKNNSRIGDKLLMVVDPKQIHIGKVQWNILTKFVKCQRKRNLSLKLKKIHLLQILNLRILCITRVTMTDLQMAQTA